MMYRNNHVVCRVCPQARSRCWCTSWAMTAGKIFSLQWLVQGASLHVVRYIPRPNACSHIVCLWNLPEGKGTFAAGCICLFLLFSVFSFFFFFFFFHDWHCPLENNTRATETNPLSGLGLGLPCSIHASSFRMELGAKENNPMGPARWRHATTNASVRNAPQSLYYSTAAH